MCEAAMTTKLQRYSAVTKTGVETVCLDADVAALEAENERLREVLLSLLADASTCFGGAVEWYKRTDAAKAILNEGEK